MRILLVDILRSSLEVVWPSVEHSIGLMYIAAYLRQQFGKQVSIRIRTLISKPHQLDAGQVWMRSELEDWQPKIVGIRSLTIGRDSFHAAAETVKNWNAGCFLVTGGPYATDNPEEALGNGKVDCAVIGEGEITMSELVRCLINNESIANVPGIAYCRGKQIIKTAARRLIPDLDALPFPDYSLIDFDAFSNQYLTFTSKIYQPHANILTTRGCPYQCAYCHNILGKLFRARSPENVFSEIRYLYDHYGITDFQIIDDIFNLDLPRAKAICDLITASRMKLTLSFPNAIRGDRVDEELIDKMAAAGTRFISYAVETASPRLQQLIKKNLNLDKIFQAIEYTAKAEIITRGFFMLGFPTETEAEALRTIEFAKASSLCGATYFTVVYFPGTELYKLALQAGYFQDREHEVQRDYVQVGDGPYAFSRITLVKLKEKAIREFAFTKERIENAFKLLPRYFTPREIDGFLMAYIVSSKMTLDDVKDETVRHLLKRHFVVADRFSQKSEFYV